MKTLILFLMTMMAGLVATAQNVEGSKPTTPVETVDSVVSITDFQNQVLKSYSDEEKAIADEANKKIQAVAEKRTQLYLLIADTYGIQLDKIVAVEPRVNTLIFKLRK